MSKWTEDTATECGHTVFIHEDWDGPPKFCKECKEVNDAGWHEKKCVDCGEAFFVHVDWENPPKLCKECKNKFQDLNLSCTICNNSFVWSAGSQRKAQENGWEQPKKCPKCRDFIKENTPLKIGCKFCQNIIRWSPIQQLMERSEEHTSELQSHVNLVCRLLLEKKNDFQSSLSRHLTCLKVTRRMLK